MSQSLEFKIPEGYVFDKENSTDEVIRFKPKKITYKNVIENLYSRGCYYINNNPTSARQQEQLLALNKLMNVAKYLNGDWEPEYTNFHEQKLYIRYDFYDSRFCIGCSVCYRHLAVYFKSEELALQAIEILGEEEVKKALGIFE